MSKIQENELRVDYLASGGMNPWAQHDSSSRVQMIGGHLSQALVINGCSTRRCLTGIEREFGRHTFSIKVPADIEVIRVIERYPKTLSIGAIRENPVTIVVYEDVETKRVGILTIPRFSCKHQHFGFKYNFNQRALQKLHQGSNIAGGTIIADSPAVDELGNYRMGVETEIAFMSVPGIIEDGVIVSRAYVEKLKSKGFESRVAGWGSNWYPLNLYGTETEYKPFPDIGENIRDDGLLFALRRYDENDLLGPVEMTPAALREPDYTFDKLTYAEPGARVVDVLVHHEVKNSPPPTPVGMEGQTMRYYEATVKFYNTLLETYNELKKRRKESLDITPEFHRLLVEALSYRPEAGKQKATLMIQRQPLDDWRVEVRFEYDVVPDVGFKLTDFHGGKGVICDVWPTEDMPMDAEGNRAEIIMDGDSTIKRMNIGRLYEQYLNATSRHVSNVIRQMMLDPKNKGPVDEAWLYLLGYYKIVSPRMYDLITGPSYTNTPRQHLDAVVKDGVYLYLPTDNPADSPTMIEELLKYYPINIGPVTYRGRSGNVVTTDTNILIGTLYIMLLEKTGGDWSGVSSSKLQHFGIPARLTKFDKHSLPGRAQPVRITGESEVRLLAATIGGEATAELLEMSNSPTMHKHVVANLLRAEQPSNIKSIIDRSIVPRGGSRSLVYVRHALECAGMMFYYTPDPESLNNLTVNQE